MIADVNGIVARTTSRWYLRRSLIMHSVDANPNRRLIINHQMVLLLLVVLTQQIQLVNVQKDRRENLGLDTGILVREERWK